MRESAHSLRHTKLMSLRDPAFGAQSWNCYFEDTSSWTELLPGDAGDHIRHAMVVTWRMITSPPRAEVP